jgi:hypothetical protein
MNNIVLLYSDVSKGMKSYGAKALVANGNIPLVIKQILQIQKQFVQNSKIHVVLGFDKSRIVDVLKKNELYNKINIIENPNYVKENQGQGFIEALQQIEGGNCYIISNGILTNHILSDNDENIIPILKRKANSTSSFRIGVRTDCGIAKYFFYDLEYEWPESCYFCEKDYDSIRKAILYDMSQQQKNGMFLFEHLNKLIDQNFILKTQIVPNKQFKKILSYK